MQAAYTHQLRIGARSARSERDDRRHHADDERHVEQHDRDVRGPGE
jgi:hypothetical protein